MSEKMSLIPFSKLIEWSLTEYKEKGSVFGVRKEKFYKNNSGTNVELFGECLASPVGPAAGPNSQLAQNIIASYLAGSRFVELKTVQKMDGEELSRCVPRPCINAEDECYNQEWSTELEVPQAFNEYVKAHFALYVLAKEFNISDKKDFSFNMSVGYDLEGIKTTKIDNFIEGMKDASKTPIWKECVEYLKANMSKFKRFNEDDLKNISARISTGITLSTLHGCPPEEIERIAKYLLEEKKVNTFIKCNPTLLGYEFARKLMDDMGYSYVVFDDHHFKNDLQYSDAVVMIRRLMDYADERKLKFGVKLTNTFPVQKKNNELPGDEMYMSGRALFPLTISVAKKLAVEFNGRLRMSFSGGADAFNIVDIFNAGIYPITVATTILKPGGYERIKQMATELEPHLSGKFYGVNVEKVSFLADNVIYNKDNLKSARPVGSRKTKSKLPLFDCYKAPCKDGGCPIQQQIPEYLSLVGAKKYKEALNVILTDNSSPAVLGVLCDHQCQHKCTRLDYEESLHIRTAKRHAVVNAMDEYIENQKKTPIITPKKAVVIGAGPGGVSVAYFLRRNGMQVKVLEKREKPYGIVKYVIPEFRISDKMIERDYNLAVSAGVEFEFGVNENYDIKKLKKEYDFVILATGAWLEPKAPFKDGADNLFNALKFLGDAKASDLNLDLGKRVAVLGGGSVAMDCARSALRCPGVEESIIVYRRTADFMPAEPEEKELALSEGVKFAELLSPLSYDGKTLKCEVMKLGERDSSGRRSVESTGEIKELAFDTVVNATGARVCNELFKKNELPLNEWGYVDINENNESKVENVYVCGDCKAGASTIVKAIADAKVVSKDILRKCGLVHDFVKHSYPQDLQSIYDKKGVLVRGSSSSCDANKCLTCDQVCELCADVCPNRANVAIKIGSGTNSFSNVHQIVHLDGMCNECGNCGIFCPHNGNPYKDKVTVFWTEDDFIDSTNKGFYRTGKDTFKVRNEDGSIVDYKLGGNNISENMKEMIVAVSKNYPYYLIDLNNDRATLRNV